MTVGFSLKLWKQWGSIPHAWNKAAKQEYYTQKNYPSPTKGLVRWLWK